MKINNEKTIKMRQAESDIRFLISNMASAGVNRTDAIKMILALLYAEKKGRAVTTNANNMAEAMEACMPKEDHLMCHFLKANTVNHIAWNAVSSKVTKSLTSMLTYDYAPTMEQYAEVLTDMLTSGSEAYWKTPAQLAEIALKAAGTPLKENARVLETNANFAMLASAIPAGCSYCGYEISQEAYVMTQIWLALQDTKPQVTLRNADFLYDDTSDSPAKWSNAEGYDFALAFPPAGSRNLKLEIQTMERCQGLMKPDAKMVTCVRWGLLSSDKEFWQENIANLEAVTLLPEGLMHNTGIGFALITMGAPCGMVKFTDLRECTISEMFAHSTRTLDVDKASTMMANDACTTVLTNDEVVSKFDCDLFRPFFKEPEYQFPTMRLGDLVEKVATTPKDDNRRQLLSETAIVLSLLRSLKPRMVTASAENPAELNRQEIAVRLKGDSVSAEYLVETLKNLRVYMQGGVIGRISEKDLMDVQVPVPGRDEQDKTVAESLKASLSDTERKLMDAMEANKRDTHMKKHAMGQVVANLMMLWRNMDRLMTKNNGQLADSMTYGKSSVADMRKSMTNHIAAIAKMVDSFTKNEDAELEPKKEIDLTEFLKKYILTHAGGNFTFAELQAPEQKVAITFSENQLNQVMENIVHNAVTHGFAGRDADKNLVEIALHTNEENDAVIDIRNNGAPLDKDLKTDQIWEYGYTTNRGVDGHGGIGGYQIRQIMKPADGSRDVEIISTPADFYTVTFRLIFHKTSNI